MANFFSMKYIITALLLILFTCCNQHDSDKQETTTFKDSLVKTEKQKKDTTKKVVANTSDSTQLQQLSNDILTIIKIKDFKKLSAFVHPTGIRFSAYAYIDTTKDKRFTPHQLVQYGSKTTKFTWGFTDGEGKPIVLSISNYFDKYVYDHDFLNAPKKATNKFLGLGNSLNNLAEAYPGADFTEFYFPGFDPQYNGMDWKTLRLVFKKETDKFYLVGIIHDEWTI
jgi:hypothetical protein